MPSLVRHGLRLRCEKGIDNDVRSAVINFCKWLRDEYDFPIRVVIYLKKAYQVKSVVSHQPVVGSFFGPFDKQEEPYMRVATGDFPELVEERGKIDALFAILETIAHEIVHYFQWLNDKDADEEEADSKAEEMLDRFAETLEDIDQ